MTAQQHYSSLSHAYRVERSLLVMVVVAAAAKGKNA
jgi:hypothetical protein